MLPCIENTSTNAVDFGYFISIEAITLTPIEGCLSPHSLIDYYRALEVDLRNAIANCGKRDIYCFQLDFAITPNGRRTLYGTLRGVDDDDFALLLLKSCEKTPFPEVRRVFIGSMVAYSASDFGEFGFTPPFSLGFAELPPTVTEALELIAKRNIAHRTTEPVLPRERWWTQPLTRLKHLMARRRGSSSDSLPTGRESAPAELSFDEIQAAYDSGLSYIEHILPNDPNNPHLWFARALRRMDASEFEAAIADLTQCIRLAPHSFLAQLQRADCYIRSECLEKALADVNAAERIDPRNPHTHNTRAHIYSLLEAWPAVEQEFTSAIALAELDSNFWTERGRARFALPNREEDAVSDLETALRLNPYDLEALRLRVQCRYDLEPGQSERAWPLKGVTHVERLLRYGPPDPKALTFRAMIALHEGQHEEALRFCAAADELFPNHPFAVAVRGLVHAATNEPEKAFEDLGFAVAAGVEWPNIFLRRAVLHADQGEFESAIRELDDAIALKDNFWQAHQLRGQSLASIGEFERAEEELRRAKVMAPQEAGPPYWLGKIKQSLGDWEAACELFTECLNLEPTNLSGWIVRGRCRAQLGRHQAALDDFDEAVRIRPEFAEALIQRAALLFACQQHQRAADDLTTAIALQPHDPFLFVQRAQAWFQLEEFDRGLSDCDESIRLNSELAAAFFLRGCCLTQLGERERVEEDLAAAIRLLPEHADQYLAGSLAEQAHFHSRRDEYDLAIKCCDEAIGVSTACHKAFHVKGIALWRLEEFGAAIDVFSELIELAGESYAALSNRGHVYAEIGELDLALADLHRAVALTSEANLVESLATARSGLGFALAASGRFDEAETVFAASLEVNPRSGRTWYYRGRMKDSQGKIDEAVDCFKQALQGTKPSLPPAQRRRAIAYGEQHKQS
ncbi:tetratricopeptide repeat protein [Lacipirellula limnantheis]|uniref:TPR repeat-containing protein YrrB n=1 Tax=Lacipirellula limnantheis TaxID=2528024 RepID=A0A517TRI5_9BACT|nr:tetratricopeptide repeat protein [Lacipirellula limnantheis]QDT70993.1 TPR repeat-containing protein YrrB [Lacipirellula limnantheis]